MSFRPRVRDIVFSLRHVAGFEDVAQLGPEADRETVEAVLARFAGSGFGVFKPVLADALVALIAPLRQRLFDLRGHPEELDRILAKGADKARVLGAPTLAAAYHAVGLSR